jgi:hypothetical protein
MKTSDFVGSALWFRDFDPIVELLSLRDLAGGIRDFRFFKKFILFFNKF